MGHAPDAGARPASPRRRAPDVCWHVALSHEVAASWHEDVDFVFIDGDHSQDGCEQDWSCWHPFVVVVGGRVVFHDAREGEPGGRGLPGPTAVVTRRFRGDGTPGWQVAAEADRTVVVQRTS